jgi:hypothetical protein
MIPSNKKSIPNSRKSNEDRDAQPGIVSPFANLNNEYPKPKIERKEKKSPR